MNRYTSEIEYLVSYKIDLPNHVQEWEFEYQYDYIYCQFYGDISQNPNETPKFYISLYDPLTSGYHYVYYEGKWYEYMGCTGTTGQARFGEVKYHSHLIACQHGLKTFLNGTIL